jgi:hypothetical protein
MHCLDIVRILESFGCEGKWGGGRGSVYRKRLQCHTQEHRSCLEALPTIEEHLFMPEEPKSATFNHLHVPKMLFNAVAATVFRICGAWLGPHSCAFTYWTQS